MTKDDEIDSAFRRVLPAIDSVLTSQYALPPNEAEGLEQKLFDWLCRYARRPGSLRSFEAVRPRLVSLACQIGHDYWSLRSEDVPPNAVALRRSLLIGPEAVAFEVAKRLEDSETGADS